jgi:hypothetical protein
MVMEPSPADETRPLLEPLDVVGRLGLDEVSPLADLPAKTVEGPLQGARKRVPRCSEEDL